MVRYFAIFLLVLLAIRLIARLVSAFAIRKRPKQQDVGTPKRRLLAECSRCGVHFDPDSSLAAGEGSEVVFCSSECRKESRAKGTEV